MARAKATIGKAFESFRESLAPEHRHTFVSTELQDVRDAVRDIQTSQRKRGSAQNLPRIEPLLEGLNKYAAVVEVLCNGTPYLPFIWAPIKLTLQLASNYRDIFEALLDAYEDIGKALPRFDRYQDTFKNNPDFQFVLAEVYSAIIEFHQRAYKFLQRRGKYPWHLIFLSLWRDFRARFNGILRTLEKHRDFLDREASSIDMLEDRAARSRMLEDIAERQRQMAAILESNEQKNRLSQFQNSITWLAADDKKQEAERYRKSTNKHFGTCKWIGQVPVMKRWLEDDTSEPVVWLNGKPGAGKSVMCTAIIELLDAAIFNTVCYYFCNNQDDGRGNPSERFLGVIATQILRAHPEFASLITNEFISQGPSSSLARLRVLVLKLLELQPYIRIIIDGIDECSELGQRALLKEVQSTCVGPNLHSKVLISSRKEPNIKAELNKKSRISLDDNPSVQLDIQHYVDHKIQLIQSNFAGELEPKFFDEIASSVAERADGMFLWVKLITKELERCFCKRDLVECVRRLPHGLKEAYGRILDRILDEEVSPQTRSLSIRILEWMSCSYRRLKTYEILDGVSIYPKCPYLDCDTKLQSRVLDLCRPLIEDGPSNTLVFVHFSAQEYILKAVYRQDKAFIRLEDAHMNIGFSCLAYLNSSFSLLPQNSSKEERIGRVLQGLHGLQPYANQYWYTHLLDYLDLATARKAEIPEHFIQQLREILKYGKEESVEESHEAAETSNSRTIPTINELAALGSFPGLQSLISKLKGFQDGLKRSDWAQKSIETVSEEICASDPSWFSSTRYQYQLALEDLLSLKHSAHPGNDLQKFRDIYGTAAYTCRYRHCTRADAGFDSLQERDKHEAQHRREYRCDIPTCMDFEKGFATRALLTKHNRKWHSQIEDGMSLVEEIRALKKSRGQDGGAIANYYNPHDVGPNGGMRGGPGGAPSGGAGNLALSDPHEDLMLFEQQNKKRLMLARQEQDNMMPRPEGSQGAPGGGAGNLAISDAQMQLMLLEQRNKKRLMLARQEQDNMGPRPEGSQGAPGAVGPNGQPLFPGTSPQGRSVNSPNPGDQMKRGTPQMSNAGMPSPLPEGQSRGSPSRGMDFANPRNSNMDDLQDSVFDSAFLHQDSEDVNNFNFDTSAFLEGDGSGAE